MDENLKGELDLSKYEGHTEGPWNAQDHEDCLLIFALRHGRLGETLATLQVSDLPSSRLQKESQGANARLIADAPLLLAEVRRLREELKVQREMHNVCLEIHTESESCLHAERQLEALRQSHARLLAALLLVGRVEKRAGVPYYNTSGGSLIHQDQMREIGAAVAEAEALNV